jgi:transcription factor 1
LMIRIRPTIPRNAWRANAFVRQWNQTRPAGTTAGRKRKDEYWTAEKLSIKHQYPLSVAVADAIHPHDEVATKLKKTKNAGKRELIGGVHVRTQIVSPDLCGTSSPECFFIERD